MVKQFRGQVKVSDVQKEFDTLVARINEMVTAYNDASSVEDIDYTVGAGSLAPAGYTLTVGGLKRIMKNMDGLVLGGKPIRVNNNTIRLTDGVLITDKSFYRLPKKAITPINGKTLYFNPETNDYQWTGSGEEETEVTKKYHLKRRVYTLTSTSPEEAAIGYYKQATKFSNDVYNTPKVGKLIWNPIGALNFTQCTAHFYKDVIDPSNTDKLINLRIENYPYMCNPITNKSVLKIPEMSDSVYIVYGKLDKDGSVFEPKLLLYMDINMYGDYPNVGASIMEPFSNSYKAGESDVCIDFKINLSDGEMIYKNYKMSYTGLVVKQAVDEITSLKQITLVPYIKSSEGYKEYPNEALNIPYSKGLDSLDSNCVLISKNNLSETVNDKEIDETTTNKIIQPFEGFNEDYALSPDGNFANPDTDFLSNNTSTVTINETETRPSSSAAYRICDINIKRDSAFCSDLKDAQVEAISGTYTISAESKWHKPVAEKGAKCAETVNTTNQPIFVAGLEVVQTEGTGIAKTNLLGTTVSSNSQAGHRNLDYWININKLLIPKGVSNPWSYPRQAADAATKVFKVIINKVIKQSGGDK